MSNQEYSIAHWSKKAGISLGAIALGVTTLLLPACTNNNEEIREGRTNVTTEDVAEVSAKNQTVGQEVTIRSQVTEAVGKSAFVMNNNDGKPILVVNATGQTFLVPGRDIPVQATGTVEPLVIADVEREYGLDLENELYVNYERQPAVIAKSLALAPTPEDLFKTPAGYFNKNIAVPGEVRKLESPNANGFALMEQGWVDDIGVVVVGVNRNLQGGPIQEGEKVVVTGVARQPTAELLQQANLGWNANQINEFLARYKNRPVIVADSVYPSAVPQ
ncbi:hypothetical protein ACE1B6_05115 [Aerosakkonemataceae cyanobacterium BLCC-F154]|uniref:Uncharacterized protein n=1 Tax=Floridaenema fluviatile BLCC-F154 TaxID=3153640 RepID=A0ABV4Y7F3_9CYAN